MKDPNATPFEEDIGEALLDVVSELDCIGNGYGWAGIKVMMALSPVLEKHVPGFTLKRIWGDDFDEYFDED